MRFPLSTHNTHNGLPLRFSIWTGTSTGSSRTILCWLTSHMMLRWHRMLTGWRWQSFRFNTDILIVIVVLKLRCWRSVGWSRVETAVCREDTRCYGGILFGWRSVSGRRKMIGRSVTKCEEIGSRGWMMMIKSVFQHCFANYAFGTLGFSFSCLNIFFLHCQRSIYIVQLEVKATSITDRFPIRVSPPEGRSLCATIWTDKTLSTIRSLSSCGGYLFIKRISRW